MLPKTCQAFSGFGSRCYPLETPFPLFVLAIAYSFSKAQMDDSPESVKPLQYSLVFTFILYYIIIYITALSWYMFSIELDMNESTTT